MMFTKAYKTALLSAAAFAVAMVAQSAGATVVSNWDYTILSGFSSPQSSGHSALTLPYTNGEANLSGSGQGSGFDNDWTKFESTGGGNTSSISIDGNVSGSNLKTNGPAVAGATFTHDNQIIPLGTNPLRYFNTDSRLTLTDQASGGTASTSLPDLVFNSGFIETDNDASPCPTGDGNPCNDIFVLTNADLGAPDSNGNYKIGQDFDFDGESYTALLTLEGLGVLSDGACGATDMGPGCIGFVTNEDAVNHFFTNLRILGPSVPEPGSLAIMLVGLGLVGIGFGFRRRNGRLHV